MNIGHAIGNWADNLILKQTIQNSDVTRLAKQIEGVPASPSGHSGSAPSPSTGSRP